MSFRRALWIGTALTALVCGVAVVSTIRHSLSPANPDAESVVFQVERGQTLGTIANNLERAGLIRDERALIWIAEFQGVANSLRAGEYRLSPADTPQEILGRITAGAVETHLLVVPEGFTARQIAERLEEIGLADSKEFQQVVRDRDLVTSLELEGDGLEGYLFPETYRIPRGLPAEEVASVLTREFKRNWRLIESRAAKRGMSMREVVTLASIVEKETSDPDERPLIASVFHNRLARGMRLETDPTVIYGIPNFDGNLRRKDLENRENPYNTYRIPGLPPGPIASPGAEALMAVVEPAQSDYLYFVSRNDGTHKFSRTYAEHRVAVNEFQRRRSRRN
ncbi:endolytic transglycosylase MltG [Myxococcota bacterium]|nr:endolytic transglycosylase MltG [Myxococcota bacterium]